MVWKAEQTAQHSAHCWYMKVRQLMSRKVCDGPDYLCDTEQTTKKLLQDIRQSAHEIEIQ